MSKKAVVNLDILAADDEKDRAAGWIEVQLKREEEEKREEGGVNVLRRQNMVRGRAERVNSGTGLL
jgi:hypothetical protein